MIEAQNRLDFFKPAGIRETVQALLPNCRFRQETAVGRCRTCSGLSARERCRRAIAERNSLSASSVLIFLCLARMRKGDYMNTERELLLLHQPVSVENGHLMMEGLQLEEIARTCGTPLYVYSESHLEKVMEEYRSAFRSPDFETRVYYASKAFSAKAMLRKVKEAGLYLDTVSLGEMMAAKAVGFDMKKVLLHGNNKSIRELDYAFEQGVGIIVCDNPQEAALIAEAAKRHPETEMDILFRVNPGVEAHTHSYIVTAHVDSKFGTGIDQMDAIAGMAKLLDAQPNVHFRGFHAHIGSQIFDQNAFEAEISTLARFAKDFENFAHLPVRFINLGGGFASWYTPEDKPIPISQVCSFILESCAKAFQENHLEISCVCIEPGRSIVGNAGLTLYTVNQIKQTPHKKYYFADGGMNDNIRPALYDAAYTCDLAGRMDQEKTEKVTVAGKCCESGDILVKEALLPRAEPGDILAVYTTGAYGQAMASHYNRLPVPGVLFVRDAPMRGAVEPETPEQLLEQEKESDFFCLKDQD